MSASSYFPPLSSHSKSDSDYSLLSLSLSPSLLTGPLSLLIPYLSFQEISRFLSTHRFLCLQWDKITIPLSSYESSSPPSLSILWKYFIPSRLFPIHALPEISIKNHLELEIFIEILHSLRRISWSETQTSLSSFQRITTTIAPSNKDNSNDNHPNHEDHKDHNDHDGDLDSSVVTLHIHFTHGTTISLPLYDILSFFHSIQILHITIPNEYDNDSLKDKLAELVEYFRPSPSASPSCSFASPGIFIIRRLHTLDFSRCTQEMKTYMEDIICNILYEDQDKFKDMDQDENKYAIRGTHKITKDINDNDNAHEPNHDSDISKIIRFHSGFPFPHLSHSILNHLIITMIRDGHGGRSYFPDQIDISPSANHMNTQQDIMLLLDTLSLPISPSLTSSSTHSDFLSCHSLRSLSVHLPIDDTISVPYDSSPLLLSLSQLLPHCISLRKWRLSEHFQRSSSEDKWGNIFVSLCHRGDSHLHQSIWRSLLTLSMEKIYISHLSFLSLRQYLISSPPHLSRIFFNLCHFSLHTDAKQCLYSLSSLPSLYHLEWNISIVSTDGIGYGAEDFIYGEEFFHLLSTNSTLRSLDMEGPYVGKERGNDFTPLWKGLCENNTLTSIHFPTIIDLTMEDFDALIHCFHRAKCPLKLWDWGSFGHKISVLVSQQMEKIKIDGGSLCPFEGIIYPDSENRFGYGSSFAQWEKAMQNSIMDKDKGQESKSNDNNKEEKKCNLLSLSPRNPFHLSITLNDNVNDDDDNERDPNSVTTPLHCSPFFILLSTHLPSLTSLHLTFSDYFSSSYGQYSSRLSLFALPTQLVILNLCFPLVSDGNVTDLKTFFLRLRERNQYGKCLLRTLSFDFPIQDISFKRNNFSFPILLTKWITSCIVHFPKLISFSLDSHADIVPILLSIDHLSHPHLASLSLFQSWGLNYDHTISFLAINVMESLSTLIQKKGDWGLRELHFCISGTDSHDVPHDVLALVSVLNRMDDAKCSLKELSIYDEDIDAHVDQSSVSPSPSLEESPSSSSFYSPLLEAAQRKGILLKLASWKSD